MVSLYLIPNWFFGYDIALELLFAVVTLCVAVYSFKLYKISQQKEFKLFGISFLLFSLSYFAWSLINFSLVEELNETTRILVLPQLNLINIIGIYSHILLFMAGLVSLFYMTTKVRNGKVYSLLLISSLLAIFLATNKAVAVYLLSSIILIYVTLYYFKESRKYENANITFLAFFLFLVANSILIFAERANGFYVFAHILEAGAFGLILGNFISIVKNGKKTQSPRNYP
jgi:hypothetical protein